MQLPAMDAVALARRNLMQALGLLALAGHSGWTLAQTRRDVVVLTSYPDEVVSRFEAAFEKAYPQWRLRMVWRMPHDALPTLRNPGPQGLDVYWTPSPRNFAILKAENRLRKLDVDRTGLPGHVGPTPIDDPDGYFAATENAGYGFAVNPGYLRAHGLPPPTDWSDLANPRYAGHIALPNPGKVGFAPVMADIALQAYGWDAGWALWSAVVANAKTLVERGGTFVGDELSSGRSGVGVSIDFFVASAIVKGAPLRFIYPVHGGVNPGQIGIMADARNPDGARDFATFTLSEAAQKLLAHADIRKLPVRPSVYAALDADYHNPFAAAQAGGYGYDGPRGLPRLPVIAALFDVVLARQHSRLMTLWPKAHAAASERGTQARQWLGRVPLTEAQADDPAIQRLFAQRADDPQAAAAALALEQQWAAETEARLDRVAQWLEGV